MERLSILEKRGTSITTSAAVSFFDPSNPIATTSASLSTVGVIHWEQNRNQITVTIYMQNDSGSQPEFALTNLNASTVYGTLIPASPMDSYVTLTVSSTGVPAGPLALAFKRNVGSGTCRAKIAAVTETNV
jgi:hypothetical protein